MRSSPSEQSEHAVLTNLDSAAASAFIKCSSLPELGAGDFPRESALVLTFRQ